MEEMIQPTASAGAVLPPAYEGNLLFLLVMYLVVASVYFLPSMVAISRHHGRALQVFFLNLYTGWTGLGFVVALVWAFTQVPAVAPAVPAAPSAIPEQAAASTPVPAASGTTGRKILKALLWLLAAVAAFVVITMLFMPETTQTPQKFVPSGMPVPADDMFGN
jgi:hypothetical protein